MPQFISQLKGPSLLQLFRWFVDLQRQRKDLQDELTEYFAGNAEVARKCFEKAGKAKRPTGARASLACVLSRSQSYELDM